MFLGISVGVIFIINSSRLLSYYHIWCAFG